MKKEELRHDPIREKIVNSITYLDNNRNYVVQIIFIMLIFIAVISWYSHSNNVKIENSSHLAGYAQNIFINGNVDEAIVKFERVLSEYPGTPGSIQSIVYLLSDALKNNDIDKVKDLLNKIDKNTTDSVILSNLNKLSGDIAFQEKDYMSAVDKYKNAINISLNKSKKLQYKINLALSFFKLDKYNAALNLIDEILEDKDAPYNIINIAEEYKAFALQKKGI